MKIHKLPLPPDEAPGKGRNSPAWGVAESHKGAEAAHAQAHARAR